MKSLALFSLFIALFSQAAIAEMPTQTDLNNAATSPVQTPPSSVLGDSKDKAMAQGKQKLDQAKVNINTAPAETLEKLPGIGKAKAQAIVAARPFAKIEDLKKVKGIKQGVFNKLKDRITVE